MDERANATVKMTVAMAISGTIGWFVVVSGRPVLDVVFWRCLFAAVALFLVCIYMGLLRVYLSRRVLWLSALGGIAIVLNWLLLFAAYSRASIAIATAVYSTQPFILVCFGAIFLAERLTIAKLIWLSIAFGGVMLILQVSSDTATVGPRYITGVLMALGAALLWAIAALITKQLTGTPPHFIALIQVCVGAIMLAPFADFLHPSTQLVTWSTLIVIGTIHTGLVYILMYDAIHRLPTHIQGSLSFIYPVVAIAVDVIAFDRRLETTQVVGAVAILVAVVGIQGFGALRPRKDLAQPT